MEDAVGHDWQSNMSLFLLKQWTVVLNLWHGEKAWDWPKVRIDISSGSLAICKTSQGCKVPEREGGEKT